MGLAEQKSEQHIIQFSNPVSLEKELRTATAVYKETYTVIHNLMAVTKKGEKADLAIVEPVVEKIIRSLERNSEALPCLCLSKSKDDYILKHAVSTCILAARFAKHIGLKDDDIKHIAIGALLGDIGKVFVPSRILYKPGKLTDEEYIAIRKHAAFSSKFLERYDNLAESTLSAASQHHERFDGSGYPNKLKGDEISIGGQITAITDTYDAMISQRMHQQAKAPTEALVLMHSGKDKQFSKEMINQFIHSVGLYPTGTLVALNNGMVSVVIEQNNQNVKTPIVRQIYDLKNKRMVRSAQDIDIAAASVEHGLRIISHVDSKRFSFNPMSAIG